MDGMVFSQSSSFHPLLSPTRQLGRGPHCRRPRKEDGHLVHAARDLLSDVRARRFRRARAASRGAAAAARVQVQSRRADVESPALRGRHSGAGAGRLREGAPHERALGVRRSVRQRRGAARSAAARSQVWLCSDAVQSYPPNQNLHQILSRFCHVAMCMFELCLNPLFSPHVVDLARHCALISVSLPLQPHCRRRQLQERANACDRAVGAAVDLGHRVGRPRAGADVGRGRRDRRAAHVDVSGTGGRAGWRMDEGRGRLGLIRKATSSINQHLRPASQITARNSLVSIT